MRPAILKISLSGLCLVMVTVGLQGNLRADELFSESRLDRVFAPPAQATPAQPGTQQPAAPQGTTLKKEELEAFIKAAGFNARKAAENLFAVDIQKDQFKFTIGFTVSPNDENLWIAVLLGTADETTVSPRVLLGLMEANATYGPAHFVYNPAQKRIDLNFALRNINLQPAMLKQTVDMLLDIAGRTSALWSNPSGNAAPGQPTTPQAPATPAQPTAPELTQPAQPAPTKEAPAVTEPAITEPAKTEPAKTEPAKTEAAQAEPSAEEPKTSQAKPNLTAEQKGLLGKWVSGPSNGTIFTLEFFDDGEFLLTTKNTKGKESETPGEFTVTADSLKLAGFSGKTLEGKLVRVNANTIVFMPKTSGAKITFVRQSSDVASK